MKNKLIQLSQVNMVYKNPQGEEFNALKDINLEINAGEYVAILGTSGSGKTTLSNVIGMLNGHYTGEYLFKGEPFHSLKESQRVSKRGECFGFIFQDYVLLDYLTAIENVALALQYHNLSKKMIYQLAEEKLISVGLGDKLHHRPYQLSGGQKQRVSVARALIKNPSVIIADEPTGALDHNSRVEVLSLLQDLNLQGVTIITVTHSFEDAQAAKRIIQVEKGQIKSDRLQRNRARYFGKLIDLNDPDSLQMRKDIVLDHLHLNFGIEQAETFLEYAQKEVDLEMRFKLLTQFKIDWIKVESIFSILQEWFYQCEEQIIKVMIAKIFLEAKAKEILNDEIIESIDELFATSWDEEASMHFLQTAHLWPLEETLKVIRPKLFFQHFSEKVRATAISLFKFEQLFEGHLDQYIEIVMKDPDARVRSNMLDFLYKKTGYGFNHLDKFNLHKDASPRVKAIWAEMLISLGRQTEAFSLLEKMLLSQDQSSLLASIWVLAKSPDFKIHHFLKDKLDSNPHLLTSIDEILKTYERVKKDLSDWRVEQTENQDFKETA